VCLQTTTTTRDKGEEGLMEHHPVASLFPLMQGDEFTGLKEDIRLNGLREPVWTWQGKVIDGRNRLRACTDLGIEPRFREWDGNGSLVAFVVSLNLHRRHLTSSQRAALAAEVEPMLAEEAKKRMRDGASKGGKSKGVEIVPQPSAKIENSKARDEAAKLTQTNGRYVSDAKAVKEAAPDLFEKVKAGTITLPQARSEVKRQEKRIHLEEKAAAAPDPEDDESPWELMEGDCVTMLDTIDSGVVRLVFADPPYNIGIDYGPGEKADLLPPSEYLDWCLSWMGRCTEKMESDGSFWVLIGDEYAGEFACILKNEMKLTIRNWIKWYETFGVNCSNKFNRTSRHLFYCVKDPERCVFNPDPVTRPSDRQTKYGDSRANPAGKLWDDVWQIPRLTGTCNERIPDFPTQLPLALLEPIILCASEPGDLVLDPFCGSATTGVAALKHGRRFVGIEKQPQFASLANLRLKGSSA
jgi:DNA modification methylase